MKQITAKEILIFLQQEGLQPRMVGDPEVCVQGFSSLSGYKAGTFTWVKSETNLEGISNLSAKALIIAQEGLNIDAPNVIYSPQSKRAFFGVIEHFYTDDNMDKPAVGTGTYISPQVKLGQDVRIGCNCVLDGEITIGDGTVIGHNVVIVNRVSIGCNCEISSGVVIGHNGVAYTENEQHEKIMVKHHGGVRIGNYVSLHPNVVIERGVIDETVIENGVKLGPFTLIGHNDVIRRNTSIIDSTLYGSVTVGENAYIVGSIIRNQCKIGSNSFIGMGSVVMKDVPEGVAVAGNPARQIKR